jgi:nucleoside 2-deoxyribosyltransferase
MPLSPSQRIALIKEISGRLGTEDWPLVDLTLKQFSLPWSEQWNGTRESYVLHMIEEASDQSLIDLAQHVGFQFEEVTTRRIEPPFWRKGMLRLFVVHLAVHRFFAAELQEALLNFGVSCFVAHNDIEPTQEWQAQIETALATCDALVALLHENFHVSNWTDQEIGFAMGRGVPAFAVRFDQDPYGFIGRFQAFNGNGKTAAVLARELFDAYRKNKQTQRRMSEVLVGLFEESGSFADAKVRIGYLEDLELWEPSFSTRIRSAAKTNSQVIGSWGVPERVAALVKKWAKSAV